MYPGIRYHGGGQVLLTRRWCPMAEDEVSGPSQRPRALIVTLYGLYAREAGGWMSVASVIKLLGHCGIDPSSARSAIFRLKRRGLLASERQHRVAGYALSDGALEILHEGDQRIFNRRRATVADGWLLAVFSVPETERRKRHQLRSRLAWLGFGMVAAGVWIAPAHVLDETRNTLIRHDLSAYVNLFNAHHVAFQPIADQIGNWWDLDRLAYLNQEFIDHYSPVLIGYRADTAIDPARAFTDYITAVTDWRRLPYSDPGLPTEILPAKWNGLNAADTFFELHDRLAKPAHQWVDSILRAG